MEQQVISIDLGRMQKRTVKQLHIFKREILDRIRGARRDEERSRAKERVFSFRDRSPLYMAPIWGTVAWLSSMIMR
mgnify:CR=1 FL=1